MRLLRSRYGGLALFVLVFLAVSFVLRVALLVRSYSLADTGPLALASVFAFGLLFDFLTSLWPMLPLVLLVVLGGNRFLAGRIGRTLCLAFFGIGVFLVLFVAAIEWFYWEEFPSSRFNLIAVDYIRDANVVLAYVWQAYPVLLIAGALAALAALVTLPMARTIFRSCEAPLRAGQRVRFMALYLAGLALAVPLVLNLTLTNTSDNWTNKNLAKNGGLSFFSALLNRNVIYSEDLYLTRDPVRTMTRLRGLLATSNSRYVSENVDDVTRQIDNGPDFARHNVIIIVVESLSAEFLGVFGDSRGMTPNLDELAGRSLLFTRIYACGTRTIRGLEALNLSLPPTPGRALAKRPKSNKLFSVERLFRDWGYRTMFFYGGYGNFDDMDAFLCNGGYELIDRPKFRPEEIHFASAWGICDGDTYRRATRECDETYKSGRKFFSMIMTLSNHTPYTYPQEIDIPSGTGMIGAVKYTDYAIGQFLKEAREKPWFDDTVFLIVADHSMKRSARNNSSPLKYHIPAYIYAPKIVKPGRHEAICSQADLMPTLLGVLGASYQTRFFGRDVLRDPANRAFIGTELDLTLLVGNHHVVLSPGRQAQMLAVAPDGSEAPMEIDPDELDMAIAYYQGAGIVLKKHFYGAK